MEAKAEAARVIAEAMLRVFLAGRGTLDNFLDALDRWMREERESRGPHGNPVPSLERYWALTWVVETINAARHEAGRIPTKEYMESRFDRLGAELELLRSRKMRADRDRPAPLLAEPYFFLLGIDSFDAKEFARGRYEADRADPAKLAVARLEAIQYALQSRLKEFLAGRGTLSILLAVLSRWSDAERAVRGEPVHRILLEMRWAMAQLIENENVGRYEAGRMLVQEFRDVQCYRIEVELEWSGLRAQQRKQDAGRPTLVRFAYLEDDLLETKELARAKFRVTHADPAQLARARSEVARESVEARLADFLAGRGTLDLLLESSLELFDSEYTLAHTDAEIRTALERYWERCWLIEATNRRRFEEGRIPRPDYLECRYARLEAEVWLAEPRAYKRPKPRTLPEPTAY
jgi:hypothetical protein